MNRDHAAGATDALLSRTATSASWPEALSRLMAQTHVRLLLAILVVALGLRLAWVVSVQPDPRDGRFDDTIWYYNTALHLNEGDGYVFPGDAFCEFADRIGCDELPPTALWAPGYPLLLASAIELPGDDVANARALNIIAGLGLVLGVYYLGSKLWDRRAGLIAAAAMAAFPSAIFFSSLVMTETIFAAASVGLLCLAAAWTLDKEQPPTAWRLMLLGLAAGGLAMLRPEGAVFVGVIALAWLATYRSVRRTVAYLALVVAAMAVLFVPWTVRNAVQLDAPIVGTTGLGQVVRQAHHPLATGEPQYLIANELYEEYNDVPFPEREIKVNSRGVTDSADYAFGNLDREWELMPHRLAAFYRGDRSAVQWNQFPDGDGNSALSGRWEEIWGAVSDSYYYAVIGVAVFGLLFWLWRSSGKHWLVFGPILAYSAMWALLFTGEARYHLPLVPMFVVIGGIGLAASSEAVEGFVARLRRRGEGQVRVVRLKRARLASMAERLGNEDTPRVYTDSKFLVRELFWRRFDALFGLSAPDTRGRALDFGGGNGVLLPTLARAYDEVHTVDLRAEMADEVRRADKLDNVTVHQGALETLDLLEGGFDTIVAADVLEHITELDALIERFERLLAPGGELLVSAPTETPFYELGRKVFGYTKPDDHYHDAAYIERVISRRLIADRKTHVPFGVSLLAAFSIVRYVKPPS